MLTEKELLVASIEVKSGQTQIERDTARKWTARAIAFYAAAVRDLRRTGQEESALQQLLNGYDAHQEALEHTAKSDNSIEEVEDYLNKALQDTFKAFYPRLK